MVMLDLSYFQLVMGVIVGCFCYDIIMGIYDTIRGAVERRKLMKAGVKDGEEEKQ